MIGANNTAELMLGGVVGDADDPRHHRQPDPDHVRRPRERDASRMSGDSLVFGNLTLDKLYVSFQATLVAEPARRDGETS